MVPDQIVDHVVTLIGLSKIFFCVIDHAIGADRFHKIDIARAANSGDLSAERLRDLDGESADAARRAVDQNFLSALNVSLVAKTLQCGEAGDRNRARLFECDVVWFHHGRPIRFHADVIRYRPVLRAKNFVAWLEVCDILSNCLDHTGEIGSEAGIFWLAHAADWAYQPSASDHVAIDWSN